MALAESEKRRILSNIAYAKRYHETEFWNRARKDIRLYEGYHWPDKKEDFDRITVNFIRMVIDIKTASIAYRPPNFYVYPRGEEYRDSAELWQAILPYLWRETRTHPETRRALRDSYIVGIGAVKTGYRFQTRKVIDESGKRGERAEREQIQYDNVFAERINMKNLFLDPEMDAPDWRKARFVVQKLVLPYENAVRMGFDPKKMETECVDERYRIEKYGKDVNERYVVYEYHDLINDRLIYIAGNEDGIVRDAPTPYHIEGPPYVLFHGKDMWDNPYGMSTTSLIEDINRELNLIHSRLSTRTRRFLSKYVAKGLMDEKAKNALMSDEEGAVVEIDENGSIDTLKEPPFPQELVQYARMLQDLLTQVTNVNEYMRGLIPGGRKTAYEVQTLQVQGGAVAQDEQATYEQACTDIARNYVQLGKQFFDEERTIRIAGASPGQYQLLRYTPEEIKGEFDIDVEMGSTRFENREMERYLALQLYNATAGNPNVNQVELLRTLFEKFNMQASRLIIDQVSQEPQPVSLDQPPPEQPEQQLGMPPELAPLLGGFSLNEPQII